MNKTPRALTQLLLAHLRIGYVSVLLFLDLALLSLVAIDIIRLQDSSLYMAGTLGAALLGKAFWAETEILVQSLLLASFLLFVLPLIVAAVRISLAPLAMARSVLGRRGLWVSCLHIGCVVTIIYFLFTSYSLERLSGEALLDDGMRTGYGFMTTFRMVATNILSGLAWFGPTVLLTVAAAEVLDLVKARALELEAFGAKHKARTWLRAYLGKVRLADLRSELYPTTGLRSGNFNASSIAPELRGVRRRTRSLYSRYQSGIPGSREAEFRLQEIFVRCASLLRRSLAKGDELRGRPIEILPGTSRALEVAIAKVAEPPRRVILSPFEHPVEESVAAWLSRIGTNSYVQLTQQEDLADRPWTEVSQALISVLREAVDQAGQVGEKAVLVISEVWWATGLEVPIPEVVDRLRSETAAEFAVVVDGAHVPGNLSSSSGLSVADAYVTSAHKWLFAPDPCGILVLQDKFRAPIAYDAWGGDLPESTASIRMVASLLAALEQVHAIGIEYLRERSFALKSDFLNRLGRKLTVVGRESGLQPSLMLAVEPAQGFTWKARTKNHLLENLAEHGISVTVTEFERGRFWVRAAFPYFLDVSDVRRLASALHTQIRV